MKVSFNPKKTIALIATTTGEIYTPGAAADIGLVELRAEKGRVSIKPKSTDIAAIVYCCRGAGAFHCGVVPVVGVYSAGMMVSKICELASYNIEPIEPVTIGEYELESYAAAISQPLLLHAKPSELRAYGSRLLRDLFLTAVYTNVAMDKAGWSPDKLMLRALSEARDEINYSAPHLDLKRLQALFKDMWRRGRGEVSVSLSLSGPPGLGVTTRMKMPPGLALLRYFGNGRTVYTIGYIDPAAYTIREDARAQGAWVSPVRVIVHGGSSLSVDAAVKEMLAPHAALIFSAFTRAWPHIIGLAPIPS